MEKKIEHYDVVIIGGGAAGMTAGIYCGARTAENADHRKGSGGRAGHVHQ